MVAQVEARRTTTMTKIREGLMLIGAVVVVLGGLLGGVRLVVAPLHTEIQAMRRDVQAIHGRLDRMQDETKAVREDIAEVRKDITAVRERLVRVEALLERDTDPAATPEAPQ